MIGVFFAGQIEKNQTMITKAMVQTIINCYPDLILFQTFSSDKLVNLLDDTKNIRIVKVPDNKGGWNNFRDECLRLLWKLDIKCLIVLKVPMLSGFRKNDQKLYNRIADKFRSYTIGDDEGLGYESVRMILRKLMFIECASDFCDIIHYVFDPNELFLVNEKRVGILESDEMSYIPLYEPTLISGLSPAVKTQDLFFYATAMTAERKYLVDLFTISRPIPSFDIKVFDRTNRNEILGQSDYYRKMSSSRFTLIVPPYDKTSFSIIRFIEAVACDCLPLIYDKVDLHDLELTFADIYEIIVRYHLFVSNIDDMLAKTDQLNLPGFRDRILCDLKQTASYKMVASLDWCKERWDKIVEEVDG